MPMPARTLQRIRREFFPEDYALAVRILTLWDTRDCAPGESPARMHNAVLNLALGRIASLEESIEFANQDFRDVLLWGEYGAKTLRRCVVVPPGGAAPDPVESAFLESIRADPGDNTHRLVY